ncbi:MAG TPA: magnesium/cobalt transporter CorA [Chromatiales bacterium]|nr:magnesium/cobalt transporter CorA [Chromatiales bacterium]
MITVYMLEEGHLRPVVVTRREDLPEDAFWVDLLSPTAEERRWVEERYGQALPSEAAVEEIEFSSRFFTDQDNGLHIRSFFLYEYPERPRNITVAFILNRGRLFTLRSEKLETFHIFKQQALKRRQRFEQPLDVLLRLFEIKVDQIADVLEGLHKRIEAIGTRLFEVEEEILETILRDLSTAQDINDQLRLGMMDKQRVLSFLLRSGHCPPERTELLNEILRDIESLAGHSMFLFEKADALMNATMGRINIEQNKIIKIFSIAAVVLLPPTLVASIYGMNFRHMPELDWPFGYPMAVLVMILSAIAPYVLFKKKGWL